MESEIDQVAPKTSIFQLYGSTLFPTRGTFKQRETPSGLDLSFVYVFCCLAFCNFSGTVVTKYMIFLIVVTAPKI